MINIVLNNIKNKIYLDIKSDIFIINQNLMYNALNIN